MAVDVVVGGQGGDEGKGLMSAYLSTKNDYAINIRVPRPNAGHSTEKDGKKYGLAAIPSGFVNKGSRSLIGRGGIVLMKYLIQDLVKTVAEEDRVAFEKAVQNRRGLEEELEMTGLTPKSFGIDPYTQVVTPKQFMEEYNDSNLKNKVGSVLTGTGPAMRDRVMRNEEAILRAKDVPFLKPYLVDTTKEIYRVLQGTEDILVECDQGFKLSLIHGEFPYVTSRDTTASEFISEIGIGPRYVRDIYAVFKPYTTRVAPGPLDKEIVDEKILDWAHNKGGEKGTVSKRLRRLGEFEWENARKAILLNSANRICFTHMDFFQENKKAENEFLKEIEKKLGHKSPNPKISLLSYGPGLKDEREYED